jgi:7,8-dihydro-6-hydroxymethylpterin-pyrophosphokinase
LKAPEPAGETCVGLGFGANLGDSARAVAAALRAVESRA